MNTDIRLSRFPHWFKGGVEFFCDVTWKIFLWWHCGTVKREASRASLKVVTTGQIIDTKQLFEWCNSNI